MGAVRMRVNREVPKFILLNFFIKHLRHSIHLVLLSKFIPITDELFHDTLTLICYITKLRKAVCFVAPRPPLLAVSVHKTHCFPRSPQISDTYLPAERSVLKNIFPSSREPIRRLHLRYGPGITDRKKIKQAFDVKVAGVNRKRKLLIVLL